jgi:hypothetical protein
MVVLVVAEEIYLAELQLQIKVLMVVLVVQILVVAEAVERVKSEVTLLEQQALLVVMALLLLYQVQA